MTTSTIDLQRTLSTESGVFDQLQLVDNAEPASRSAPALITDADEDALLGEQPAAAPPSPVALTISRDNIARGIAVRQAFEIGDRDSEVAERLLEEFVAGEVPIVRELQNVEGALVALLGQTLLDPALALRVANVLKETTAVSAAVRRRAETSLAAAASLRAQKAFLATHRSSNRGPYGK